jgi:hypothetical protein
MLLGSSGSSFDLTLAAAVLSTGLTSKAALPLCMNSRQLDGSRFEVVKYSAI